MGGTGNATNRSTPSALQFMLITRVLAYNESIQKNNNLVINIVSRAPLPALIVTAHALTEWHWSHPCFGASAQVNG